MQECGFDYPSGNSPAANYEQVEITGKPTLVPWKSTQAGRIERVVAEIAGGPADSVRYYRESNNVVMTAPGIKANQQQIMLNGLGKNEEDKLYAWYAAYNHGDTNKTYARVLAGQLNTVSYEKKAIKVVLVPVNNSSCPDAAYVQAELNRIYKSAVVEWNVLLGNKISVTPAAGANAVFDNTDKDANMNYTPDMKAAINVFSSNPQYNKETYYLFFLDNAKDQSIKGYMPMKGQFGFIFKYNQYPDEYLRTIAHELGHGPFRLYHTFSDKNKYPQPEGATDNLMDYAAASATNLNKYQWDWVHDPEWRIYWGEEEEEGESSLSSVFIKEIIDKIRQGNKEKKDEIGLSITSGLEECYKLTLGKKDYSYIKMTTTGFNLFLDKESSTKIQTNVGEVKMSKRPTYNIKPSEESVTTFIENGINYTKYQFHEIQTKKHDAPYADTRETTGSIRVEIIVKSEDAESFKDYLYPIEEISVDVDWVSQFNSSIFGNCTGCWQYSCCKRACEYMLGFTNCANCSDEKIAAESPILLKERIILTKFDSDNNWKTEYNSKILISTNDFKRGLQYIKDEIKIFKRAVVIGLHYTNISIVPPGNTNKATYHYMVIVAYGEDKNGKYLRFYDPGRYEANKASAISRDNKLYIKEDNFIKGDYRGNEYTITEVRVYN